MEYLINCVPEGMTQFVNVYTDAKLLLLLQSTKQV